MHIPGAQRQADVALSVDVEDWFHTENMKGVVSREAWDRCELRVEANTMRMLEILEAVQVKATFFVLGWVAERCPQLVRRIAAAGHEVGSHGFNHELVYSLDARAFRQDVTRAKALLEDLTGAAVNGYRAPCFSITQWAIPILQETGHTYDSSMVPTVTHDRYGRLEGFDGDQSIVALKEGFHEVCVSCLRLSRRGIPWGGGGYFRFVPYRLWMRGIDVILKSGHPYVFYIHPWEVDPGQPSVSGMSALNAYRQRVNLHRCEARFAALSAAFQWMTIGELIARRVSGAPSADLPAPGADHKIQGAAEPARAPIATPFMRKAAS
jgi:polysaccharide deacetylase family protein (PEP-CTERM system associated)